MAIEIERRFLLKDESWRQQVDTKLTIKQGYMVAEKECSIRVRVIDQQAWLTIKGYVSDISRNEFEYPIPLADAEQIMATLCPLKIQKIRHIINHKGFIFEIDEYFDDNAPLIIAEIEIPSENTQFEYPKWLGEEVTENGQYSNAYLSKHPYSKWQK